ncbi:MAG: cardiolipin synthase [Phycisphaerales bacterium]|nr:MAG: cardiolipin synthase [Phycisphaerales bacterium]
MMLASTPLPLLILALVAWLALGCASAGHAIMYKRDPRSASLWVLVSFMLPLVGPWLYWVLGINRVERRAIEHLGRRGRPFDPEPVRDQHDDVETHTHAVGHLGSLRTIGDRVARLPMLPSNTLTPLHNGEQAYPRMLDAIRNAQRSVTLASYIFDWDDVGHDFANALGEAARRGVKVHVLVDGLGALKSFSRMGRLLIKSRAQVAAFFPLRFPLGRVRLNLRNHRKIMVVDGRTGFTGGMNISQRYMRDRPDPGRVEDLHFEITGPVVAEMQHAFAEDWAMATDEILGGRGYFPKLAPTGPALCRGISSGPDEDFEIIHHILQAAFASAQHSVRIVTPYFVPTWPLISAMSMAALRGVEVTLVLPSMVDLPYMRWVADAYIWQLLQHGIRVYRRPPPFVHTKLMIVDERWILLGSANLDRRSFRLNFEFNVEAYEVTLAGELCTWLDQLAQASEEVTLEQVDSRSTSQRLRDGLAKIAAPYL